MILSVVKNGVIFQLLMNNKINTMKLIDVNISDEELRDSFINVYKLNE